MDNLVTNKHKQNINQAANDNVKALEEMARQIDWPYLGRLYAVCFGVLLGSLFLLIVTVRLALHIF